MMQQREYGAKFSCSRANGMLNIFAGGSFGIFRSRGFNCIFGTLDDMVSHYPVFST